MPKTNVNSEPIGNDPMNAKVEDATARGGNSKCSACQVDEVSVHRRLENEQALNAILRTVVEPVPLREILGKCLDILLATSWLSILPRGGIFLVGDDPGVLELVAERNLSKPLLTLCARVPFGHCLCGRAAEARRIMHTSCVDQRHDNRFAAMAAHGHYNVPILADGKTCGVMVLYLPEGYGRNDTEVEFLESVADILSLVVRLKRYQEHLEDMVKARTEELLHARQRAEIANQTKTEFLANVSHELRTPLNAIIGFSDMMTNDALCAKGVVDHKEYAQAINGSGHHLKTIIDDILDVSQIELDQLVLDDDVVIADHAVDFVLQLVARKAAELKLRIVRDFAGDAVLLRCDGIRLRQILLNVIDNALKYTEAGGEIRVAIDRDLPGGIVISVADTGVGIDPECVRHVTEPFFRADGVASRAHSGTGLGLALAKSLMDAHDGDLEIDSAVGVGTVVRLRFPPARTVPGDSLEARAAQGGRGA